MKVTVGGVVVGDAARLGALAAASPEVARQVIEQLPLELARRFRDALSAPADVRQRRVIESADEIFRFGETSHQAGHAALSAVASGRSGTLGFTAEDPVFSRTPVTVVGPSLNRGNGSYSDIFPATDPSGSRFVVKVLKPGYDEPLDGVDAKSAGDLERLEALARGISELEAYGGPKFLGHVRVLIDGVWKPGIAMQQLAGVDMSTALVEPASFAVTARHGAAIEKLMDAFARDGVLPTDLSPRNLMLLPDGSVAPYDGPQLRGATRESCEDGRWMFQQQLQLIAELEPARQAARDGDLAGAGKLYDAYLAQHPDDEDVAAERAGLGRKLRTA